MLPIHSVDVSHIFFTLLPCLHSTFQLENRFYVKIEVSTSMNISVMIF